MRSKYINASPSLPHKPSAKPISVIKIRNRYYFIISLQRCNLISGRIIYGRSRRQGPLQPPDPPGGELCRSGALTTDCFHAGDGRVSEQPGLTAMHTVWVRFHNKVTTVLSKFNPHWTDEKLYQETRKIVYSLVQHITYREFLPIVLGPEVMDLFELRLVRKGFYTQYNSKVNPAIANSFSTAAYRFGHSMVQNSFIRMDHKHRPLFNSKFGCAIIFADIKIISYS